MDNICVGASFIAGIILCQLPEFPYTDITAFGLVALTVYYFLCKYNVQMQEIREQNKLIMQRQEIDNNNHNKALEQLAEAFKELSQAILQREMERNNERNID